MWAIPVIITVVVLIIIGRKNEQWHAERGTKPKATRTDDYYDDNEDEEYVTRSRRRREKKRQRRASRFKDDPREDYDTYTDEKGNEHSLDYDEYCDDCDEYHEE